MWVTKEPEETAAEPATAYQIGIITELLDKGRLRDHQAADLIILLRGD